MHSVQFLLKDIEILKLLDITNLISAASDLSILHILNMQDIFDFDNQ